MTDTGQQSPDTSGATPTGGPKVHPVEQARRDLKQDNPELYAYIADREAAKVLDSAGDEISGHHAAANIVWARAGHYEKRWRARAAGEEVTLEPEVVDDLVAEAICALGVALSLGTRTRARYPALEAEYDAKGHDQLGFHVILGTWSGAASAAAKVWHGEDGRLNVDARWDPDLTHMIR